LLLLIAAAPDFAVAHTARPQLSMGAHTVAIAEGSQGGGEHASGGHFRGHFPTDAPPDFHGPVFHGEHYNSHPYVGGFERGLRPFAYAPLDDFPPLSDYPGRYTYADALPPLDPGVPVYAPSLDRSTPNVWYFCPGPNMYYPNLTECPGGWQQITQ
jgi:hypothetical protein